MYSGYGITFSSRDWWTFDNVTARNAMIFDADIEKSDILITHKYLMTKNNIE